MSAGRWKRQERVVAAALATRRLPNTGAGNPDIRTPGWAIQVKTRKTLPGWLWAALEQAGRDAAEGEEPVVVLAEVGQGRKARRVVLLDFEVWLAKVAKEPGMEEGDSV